MQPRNAWDPAAGRPSNRSHSGHLRCPTTTKPPVGWTVDPEAAEGAAGDTLAGRLHRLCVAAMHDLTASGVSVSVLAGAGVRGATVATDPTTQRIEELQLLPGAGPCLDALSGRHPVLVSELDDTVQILISDHGPTDVATVDGVAEDIEYQAVLFQAQGMVMVQLWVSLVEAMVRIRAYAFAEQRRLTDVARDIVARVVLVEPDRQEPTMSTYGKPGSQP